MRAFPAHSYKFAQIRVFWHQPTAITESNTMPIEINSRERELLLEETNALIEQVREPQRSRYVQLRDALERRHILDFRQTTVGF